MKAGEEEKDAIPVKPKEVTEGRRWVALTGILDHKQLRENYAKALKMDFAAANPHYLRLESERQEMKEDGTWPEEWEAVDLEANQDILDDAAEIEEEQVPPENMIKVLVDHLPFLKSSYYRGVHVAELVPAETLKTKGEAPKTKPGAAAGRGGGSMSGASGSGAMDPSIGGSGSMSGSMSPSGSGSGGMDPSMGSGSMSGGRGMSGMMMGSGSGSMSGTSGGGGPEDTDFEKKDATKVMVRALDFTVDPDVTYRYRVRIVVKNPNFGWEMVANGVDTKAEEIEGPWSEPSEPVSVPANVSTYAMGPGVPPPGDPREQVKFQVAKFNPEDGLIVVKTFDQAPGQIVGSIDSARVPRSDNKDTQSKQIDFNSRQILVDTVGRPKPMSSLNMQGAALAEPTRALMMRPDGTLVLRDQAQDMTDGEMSEMKSIYDEILAAVQKPKKRRGGGGGMMGSGSMSGSGGMSGPGGSR